MRQPQSQQLKKVKRQLDTLTRVLGRKQPIRKPARKPARKPTFGQRKRK